MSILSGNMIVICGIFSGLWDKIQEGLNSLLQDILYNTIYILLYYLEVALLKLVAIVESMFNVFAGVDKVSYDGQYDFLINIFFSHSTINTVFWGMALLGIVLCLAFAVVAVARKTVDFSEHVKQSLGQILSNTARAVLTILLVSAVVVASLNIANVLLERINYLMSNATAIEETTEDREFTDQEYAAMARIINTLANYSMNPSFDSRYNINSCFNAIQGDLYALYQSGMFDYDYSSNNNFRSWQYALQVIVNAADVSRQLPMDTYNSDVVEAVTFSMDLINNSVDFKPLQRIEGESAAVDGKKLSTDILIFLTGTLNAANNAQYNTNPSFTDSLRVGYYNGSKSYANKDRVRADFDIGVGKMGYLVVYLSSLLFIVIMSMCIFNLIVRLFNLLLLYLVAPFFASSMPLDEGSRFQTWTQSFVIQLFTVFGMLIAMRLYMVFIPIVVNNNLVFFPDSSVLNYFAKLFMVLGGIWAVWKSNSLITGLLAGNPGAAAQLEAETNQMVGGKLLGAGAKMGHAAAAGMMAPGSLAKGAIASKMGQLAPNSFFGRMGHGLANRSSQHSQAKAQQARLAAKDQTLGKIASREKKTKDILARQYGNGKIPPPPRPPASGFGGGSESGGWTKSSDGHWTPSQPPVSFDQKISQSARSMGLVDDAGNPNPGWHSSTAPGSPPNPPRRGPQLPNKPQ